MSMVQGDAYRIELTISSDGLTLTGDGVELVEVTLLGFKRCYPGEVTYADGKFFFPVTQEETFHLPPLCPMQVRVKFPGGDVVGSPVQMIDVERALSKAVI